MASSLKLSPSHVERTMEDKPHLKQYADRLRAMDKDGNGELDLSEVCEVLDEMATIEKQRRLLKWVAIISGIFALLSIASIVGLTYAVVHLSKDTQLSSGGSVMVSKNSGVPVATGAVVSTGSYADLLNMTPERLRDVESIIVPDGDIVQVFRVASIAAMPNISATITTTTGKVFEVDQDGIQAVNATSGARRLLGITITNDIGGVVSITTEIDVTADRIQIEIFYSKSWYEFFTDEIEIIDVVLTNTIGEVKLKYADPSEYSYYLEWKGVKLDDNKTIKQLGITDGAVLKYVPT